MGDEVGCEVGVRVGCEVGRGVGCEVVGRGVVGCRVVGYGVVDGGVVGCGVIFGAFAVGGRINDLVGRKVLTLPTVGVLHIIP